MASRRILFDDEEEDEEYDPNKDSNTAAENTTTTTTTTAVVEEKTAAVTNLEEEEEYIPNNEEIAKEETKEEVVAENKEGELVEEKLDDEEEYSPNYQKFDAENKEIVNKVEAEIDSSSKAQTAGGATGAPKATVMVNTAPTDAEIRLKEEAENAKTKLIKEIQDLKLGDEAVVGDLENEKEDPRVQKFNVINPVKISGHVKYTVNGVDDEGDFTEVRRFREFHALGQVLRTRWPGCYVPSIPEKKMLQKNNEQFTEERRCLLERFMKEIAKYDYIVYSKEFKVFARGKGEIDKVLFSLPKQTPMQVLEKYRLNFKIDEEQDQSEVNNYKERIMIFQQFLKKAIGIMEMQKKQLKNMSSVREKQDAAQSEFMYELMKYEDIGIAYYSDQDYKRRILTHPDSEDLKEKIDKSSKKWRNPYREAYLWLKGEFLDVSGMYDGLQGREGVMKAQLNTEQKKRDDQKELDKLTLGKTTMKSLFKSKSQKESNILSLQAAIEIAEQEIIDFRKLINFLTIYHGQIAIPKFKAAKAKMYLKSLNNFCVKEISNAHLAATLYNSLLDIDKKE